MNIYRKTKTQTPRANHNDLLGGLILFNWSYRKRYVLLQLWKARPKVLKTKKGFNTASS